MPSKRTNDSVDRILEDLNMQQAEAGLRDSVTDHQVDEILRSVGISVETPQPPARGGAAFSAADGLDDLLRTPRPQQPAPQPKRAAPYTAQPSAAPQPRVQPAPQPVQPAAPAQPPVSSDTTLGFNGDTTRTGIIKGFLLKMAPDGGNADAAALNQGKNQFQKFFKDSVAVVPDENGRLREPGKKKRGLFGLKAADDTGEFVPINVSLGGAPTGRTDWEREEAAFDRADAAQEYYPDAPQPAPTPTGLPKKKNRWGMFGHNKETTEELVIPEARVEEPVPQRAPAMQPQTEDETSTREVWRSKYTRPPRSAVVDPLPNPEKEGSTVELIRDTVDQTQANPAAPAASGMTGTIYRKKKNTVEFTPGQKLQTAPPPQPMPQHSGEPVGEPIETPRRPAASTGFTMQMDAVDARPLDSTQDFLSAYNAVRRPQKAAPAPQPAPAPAAQPAAQEPYTERVVIGDQTREVIEETGERLLPHRERDDVDTLVDTLTGRVKLTPVAPTAPAHTGFTQDLSAAPASVSAHTGFTQQLGAAPAPAYPAQPAAHSGYTQNLAQPDAAAPNTSAFVSDIANAINTQPISGDTARFDAAADRLTGTFEELPPAHSRGKRPTAADVKKAAARLTGHADDEGDDNAVSPFETAEIPVPRSREYERAEDAPAVRAELEKNLTMATVGCIVSGVAAAVLIVLGVMAAALPALPGALAEGNVYSAVALVLLLAACAANWQAFASGFKGLLRAPTPDSLSILPALGAAVQCIALLATQGYTKDMPILAGPAALLLCLNAVGRWVNAATVRDNFTLVSAKVEHAVAYRLKDAGALRAAAQGLAEPHPSVLVSRPTQIFRSFLANSAARGTSDKNQQQFAWILGGCGLAAFLFTVIRTKNSVTAATAMAGVFCLAAPLAGTLLSALPARMMQRSAAQVGAVIPGWRDIRQLGRINVLQVTSRDLFPAGCVSLAGIKPVKPEHIDVAIVYAASILSEAGPTLRDVFMNMLGENRSLLAKVDDRQTVYGKGYVGWINKRRVLVGNRALMQDYGVKIPSLEYEQHHTVNQRRVIYLAVSGKLFAMFQVAYQRDPDTAAVLETLHRAGLSLVVDCDDFNCDVKLLEAAYSLPAGSVKVLTSAEHDAMAPAVAWLPESEGSMLHLGSFASFVGGLEAAAGAAEGEHKAAIVLQVSVLLSSVVGVLLTLTGGLVTLPLAGIVLYQAAWSVLTLIFPLLQRY